jgi:hypothetical protein
MMTEKQQAVSSEVLITRMYESASREPVINCWGHSGPPIGHRADCKPSEVATGKCFCRRAERRGFEVRYRR